MTKSRHIAPPRRPWTRREERILRRDYPDRPSAQIARELARPVTSVYARAKSLGLFKSAQFQAGPFSGRLRKGHAERGIGTRFRKGQVCWSKGLRRPGYAPGRMAETQFKKGNRPHNYRWPIGSVRLIAGGSGKAKPYLYEKVSEASPWTKAWVQLHRLVWRRAGRRIAPRHALAFKDGNQFNCALENLECIHRGELARRNHWTRRIPKELQEVFALRIAIKRKLTLRGRDGQRHRETA
ncbi:MAG: HNH endonuclease [Steroidobacteraceae bacterium]